MKPVPSVLALCTFLLAACAQVGPLLDFPTASPTLLPQPSLTQAATLPPPTTATPTEAGPITLRLWVPPRFDPYAGSPAGELLRQRLEEFEQQNPGIQLETRVKAIGGAGGMLDSLVTTSAAAPQAMPDVIALAREDLEAAAVKGLLRPLGEQVDLKDGVDWFDYARQLGQVQDSVYGIPFAGDVSLVVYRPETLPAPPAGWSELLESVSPFMFPAGDPHSFFTLTQYQARGGAIQDSQGQPLLDAAQLEEVLNLYAQARERGIMPDWLVQLEEDQEAWESFASGAADQAFSWSTNFLTSNSTDLGVAPAPTVDGSLHALARGWVWAVSAADGNQLPAARQLAAWLADSSFLAGWTQAAGYLPTRPSALDSWPSAPHLQLLANLSASARLQPSGDILLVLGPSLRQAAISVLSGESDPATAARTAAGALASP